MLELCRAGIDHDVVAQEVGYKNGETVRAIYWEEINKRRNSAVDDCIAVQLDRTEAIFQGAYPKARKGDDKAANTAFKAMDHEAKLRGLTFSDKLDERRTQIAEDVSESMLMAMNAFADAIGLTPEQEAIRQSVIKEQMAAMAGMVLVSLSALVAEQKQKNDLTKAALVAEVLGEDP